MVYGRCFHERCSIKLCRWHRDIVIVSDSELALIPCLGSHNLFSSHCLERSQNLGPYYNQKKVEEDVAYLARRVYSRFFVKSSIMCAEISRSGASSRRDRRDHRLSFAARPRRQHLPQ